MRPRVHIVRKAVTRHAVPPARHRSPPKEPSLSRRLVPSLATGRSLLASPVRGFREASSSGESLLLLAIGLGLVVLVIGEMTFLRAAAPRLRSSAPPTPTRRREPDEPLPIRRVQLRR